MTAVRAEGHLWIGVASRRIEAPDSPVFLQVPEREGAIRGQPERKVAAVRAEGEGRSGDGAQVRLAEPVEIVPLEAPEVLASIGPGDVLLEEFPDALPVAPIPFAL